MFTAKLAFSSLFLLSTSLLAETVKPQEQKELEVVNFNSVKKVLQQDGLSQAAEQKKKQVAVLKTELSQLEKERFNYPSEDQLWGFMTEYWLVKNAQLLGWDFEKPEYGLENSFRKMLESFGYYQKRFKILLVNTPTVVRGGLPGREGESVLLLSVPFIRSLDLSKLEISLLLLEDFFRLELGYFKKQVATPKFRQLAGTSFFGQKPDGAMVEEVIKNYSQQVLQKGFTFLCFKV